MARNFINAASASL